VNWHIPEAAGVYVWSNVFLTGEELRSQYLRSVSLRKMSINMIINLLKKRI